MNIPSPNYLKMHRKPSGLNQSEFGFLFGHQDGTLVSRFEKFESCPSLPIALAYAKAFHVPVDRLFEGTNRNAVNNLKNQARLLREKIKSRPSSEPNMHKIMFLDRIISDDEPSFDQRSICRVIAFDPFPGGISFAVLESFPLLLLDYGRIECRNTGYPERMKKIIDLYSPLTLLAESPDGTSVIRRKILQSFVKRINDEAAIRQIEIKTFAQKEVRDVFAHAGAGTKYKIADVIAGIFPGLRSILPRHRRLEDEREDRRINVFDAVALGMTYFSKNGEHIFG